MRLAILLCCVVASAQCSYSINLFNNRSTPLEVEFEWDNSHEWEGYDIRAKTNDNVPHESIEGLVLEEVATIRMLNLYVDISPSNPQTTPPTQVIKGTYYSDATNTNITMRLIAPGFTAHIKCNELAAPQQCTSSSSSSPQSFQEVTVPYIDGGAYQIWYSEQ